MTGYDAVVFDLGGVFTASPFEAVRRLAVDRGTTFDEVMAVLFGPYDADTDHPWHRAERGELELEACREEIRALAADRGLALDLADLMAHMPAGQVRGEMVDLTVRVRSSGRSTALLTNNVAELRPLWRDMLPLGDLFDVVVDSSEVGCRKPDPAVFHRVLGDLGGMDPTRVVFLDDFAGNVAAAEAVGLRGILVDVDPAGAMSELAEVLELDPGS